MKNYIFTSIIFAFFSLSIVFSEINIIPGNYKDWEILQDDDIWIGWAHYGQFDWCRTASIIHAPIEEIRKIIEDVEQITMGQQVIKLNFSADYVVNQRLNLRVFYDKVITNPFISTTFPGAITNVGFSLRFTLAG